VEMIRRGGNDQKTGTEMIKVSGGNAQKSWAEKFKRPRVGVIKDWGRNDRMTKVE